MGALKPSAGAGRVGDRELAENAGKSGIDDRSEAGDGGGRSESRSTDQGSHPGRHRPNHANWCIVILEADLWAASKYRPAVVFVVDWKPLLRLFNG